MFTFTVWFEIIYHCILLTFIKYNSFRTVLGTKILMGKLIAVLSLSTSLATFDSLRILRTTGTNYSFTCALVEGP